jgi:hypothetical protein
MSREYERQEALRMAGDASVETDFPAGQAPEPYINEIVPVASRAGSRRETRQG